MNIKTDLWSTATTAATTSIHSTICEHQLDMSWPQKYSLYSLWTSGQTYGQQQQQEVLNDLWTSVRYIMASEVLAVRFINIRTDSLLIKVFPLWYVEIYADLSLQCVIYEHQDRFMVNYSIYDLWTSRQIYRQPKHLNAVWFINSNTKLYRIKYLSIWHAVCTDCTSVTIFVINISHIPYVGVLLVFFSFVRALKAGNALEIN